MAAFDLTPILKISTDRGISKISAGLQQMQELGVSRTDEISDALASRMSEQAALEARRRDRAKANLPASTEQDGWGAWS